jgi:hypothetical protein
MSQPIFSTKVLCWTDQLPIFPNMELIICARRSPLQSEWERMVQLHCVSAGLAIIFSAAMFVTSHFFIEARSAKHLVQGISASVLLEMSHQKFLP